MKLHFRIFSCVFAVAALAALALAQDQPSSPPPNSPAAAVQIDLNGSAVKLPGHKQSFPQIVVNTQTPGIVATIAPFVCLALIVGAVVYGRYRRAELLHQTLRAMVEKGAAIPPELLVPSKPPSNDFRRGVLLIGLGVGLMGLISIQGGKGAWGIGLAPLFLGVGYLVVAKMGANPPAGPGSTLPS